MSTSKKPRALKTLLKQAREKLEELEEFDSREHIEQQCERLELEVSEAAERASKHIDVLERQILKQIKEYRQRCLDALATRPSTRMEELQARIDETKSRLDDLSKESEVKAALERGQQIQSRVEQLEQELRNYALNGSKMLFNERWLFYLERGHLGELLELSASESHTSITSELVFCFWAQSYAFW